MASSAVLPRALHLQREVDHHDGVLLHDADQQDDADQPDDIQLHVEEQQRQQRAGAGRRQRGENRDGMDVALIEHAQHDVDREQRGQNEHRLRRERILKRRAVPWKLPWIDEGIRRPSQLASMARVAVPRSPPGARLKEMVTQGNCPW
jgi:hypothetical protein